MSLSKTAVAVLLLVLLYSSFSLDISAQDAPESYGVREWTHDMRQTKSSSQTDDYPPMLDSEFGHLFPIYEQVDGSVTVVNQYAPDGSGGYVHQRGYRWSQSGQPRHAMKWTHYFRWDTRIAGGGESDSLVASGRPREVDPGVFQPFFETDDKKPSVPWIHVVLAADTNDLEIGPGVGVDMQTIDALFKESVSPQQRVIPSTISANSLTRTAILNRIENLDCKPIDAVIVFFSGHAAYDANGHYLRMADGGVIYREEILSAMREKNVRLIGLISNGCNIRNNPDNLGTIPPETAPIARCFIEDTEAEPQIDTEPLFNELFFNSYGVIDINGASEGQTTLAHYQRGSSFLRPLTDLLSREKGQSLSWSQFTNELNLMMTNEVLRYYDGTTVNDVHQLKIWSLPTQNQGARFGATVVNNSGDGVLVTEVETGLPAQSMLEITSNAYRSLSPGDYIVSINGRRLEDRADFLNEVMSSPRSMELTVRNGQTGRTLSYRTSLLY